MTWTATILDSVPSGDRQETRCLITDGVSEKFVQSFLNDGTVASIQAQAMAVVANLAVRKTQGATLAPGTVIDLTPPVSRASDPPSGAEIARDAWCSGFATLQQYDRLIAAGMLLSTDATATALRASLAKDYAPAYVAGL